MNEQTLELLNKSKLQDHKKRVITQLIKKFDTHHKLTLQQIKTYDQQGDYPQNAYYFALAWLQAKGLVQIHTIKINGDQHDQITYTLTNQATT